MKTLLFFFSLFLLIRPPLEGQSLNVKLKAHSAILMNPDTGAILYEKKAHEPHYPASTMKIATALFVLDQERFGLEAPFLSSKEALEMMNAEVKQAAPSEYPPFILEHDGVVMGLKEGDVLPLNVLLHNMLLQSSNDAANVIAENHSGSIDAFINELNAYLAKRGLKHTQFLNPHGLHHPEQVTTAYEMAKIASWAFQNETFSQVTRRTEFSWTSPTSQKSRAIRNVNRLMKKGKYNYPRSIGGKTGYIASAGYNYVTGAEHEGRRLIAVLFGCPDRVSRYEDAIALFEAAFRERTQVRRLFSKDHPPFIREIPDGKSVLTAALGDHVDYSYYPSEERELSAKLLWRDLELPIRAGREVGSIVVSDTEDRLVYAAPLFATSAVEGRISSFYWLKSRKNRRIIFSLFAFVLLGMGLKRKKKRGKRI